MRKPFLIGLGVASTAITAVMGIAACGTAQPSTPSTPTSTSATATTPTPAETGATATTTTTVSQADAERIAAAAVPGSRVTETRLDTDDAGRTVWNVHLSTPNGNVEIRIDVTTGAVRVGDQPSATAGSDDGPGHS